MLPSLPDLLSPTLFLLAMYEYVLALVHLSKARCM
jgi:hypothetical protein